MILDLNFVGHNTHYATHGLHSYAAKCPPQLVEFGLQNYTIPGELVLDSMAGSGTTLVEAKIHGRNSIGFDIDPLACLIARVKASIVDDRIVDEVVRSVIADTKQDLKRLESGEIDSCLLERTEPPEFPNRDYWFEKNVQQKLALLGFHINHLAIDEHVREFLWVAFSGIILSKVSVANARDIIHSRHHYLKHPNEPDVLEKFEKRALKMRKQIQEFTQLCAGSEAEATVQIGDARALPVDNNSVDMVFTSPPYATALDYPRAHFLAVSWMQASLGITHDQYKEKGQTYIGSERGRVKEKRCETQLEPVAQSVVTQLREIDQRKSLLIERYFSDMSMAISEMNRVLKPGRHAIIVVCPSHIRKIEIPTHNVFTEITTSLGMELVAEYTRTIDSSKRVLPHVRGGFGNRMSIEYVLIYKKGD